MRDGMSAHDLSVDGGDARGRRVAIHMCIRMRWKSTRAISTGDVRGRASRPERGAGRAAERASTGPRRTVHGGKDVCGFRARAPEDGASRRAERLLRSSDRRAAANPACAGTRQKSQRYIDQRYPAKRREISQALDRHRGRGQKLKKVKSPNYPRVADWTSKCGVSRNARKCPMSVKTRRR